jgi:hypothetical protein
LRLNCPTERCHSIPMDWIQPTDEVMASLAVREAERNASVDNGRAVLPKNLHPTTAQCALDG